MNDWIGQTIGGYRLSEEIGRGGAAIVYRAYQPQLERWVALKMLDVKKAGGDEFLQRFRREARAIASLRHPNIVNIYDYGEQGEMAYIVMEYVAGGALSETISHTRLNVREALELMLPVTGALAYAHSQNIIHRDVKPGNILLARPDWPLLVDFGLAKVIGAHQRKNLTQPGVIMGTAVYLSPEQIAGQDVDLRSDQYSLAIVIYELLTGKLPFQSESLAETMIMRLYQPPIHPREVNPQIPDPLADLLMKALAREPGGRFASLDEMLKGLKQVLDSITTARQSQPNFETMRMVMDGSEILTQPAGPQLFIATSGVALNIPLAPEVLIGRRDPQAPRRPDIDLDPYGGGSAGVSRIHARLLHKPEGWLLEDLQSTNGTFINEVRLLPHRPVLLHSGDIVRFAQLTMIFNEQ